MPRQKSTRAHRAARVAPALSGPQLVGFGVGRTVREEWDSFVQHVIPRESSSLQVAQMRRAFWAGAAAIWGLTVGNMPDDEEAALALMTKVHGELCEYSEELRRSADAALAALDAGKAQ